MRNAGFDWPVVTNCTLFPDPTKNSNQLCILPSQKTSSHSNKREISQKSCESYCMHNQHQVSFTKVHCSYVHSQSQISKSRFFVLNFSHFLQFSGWISLFRCVGVLNKKGRKLKKMWKFNLGDSGLWNGIGDYLLLYNNQNI